MGLIAKALFCALAWCVLLLVSPPCAAADPAAGIRNHDGFFLRGGVGYTPLSDGVRGKADSAVASSDSVVTGQGVMFEALAGGTTTGSRPQIYGGGLLFATLPSLTLTSNGTDVPANIANALGVFGFTEIYPVTNGGISVQSLIGFANLRYGLESGKSWSANGVLAGLGLAESFWVADQWSIGIQGRAIVALVGGKDAGISQSHIAWLPSLNLIATYH